MKELYNKFLNLPFSVRCAILYIVLLVLASIVLFPFEVSALLFGLVTTASLIRIIAYLVEGR